MPDLWGSVEILVDFYKKSWLVRSFCAVFMRFCLTKGFFFGLELFSRGSNVWWINETSPYRFRRCWPWRRDGKSLPQWTRPTLYKWELLKLFIVRISLRTTNHCLRWGSHGHTVCVHRFTVYAYADRYIECIDSAYMQIYTHHHVYIYIYINVYTYIYYSAEQFSKKWLE